MKRYSLYIRLSSDKGLTVPKQDKQRSSGKGNQLQLRIQITNQVLDDEAGPRSIWGGDQVHIHCSGSDTGQRLQVSLRNSQVKPGSQTTGQG